MPRQAEAELAHEDANEDAKDDAEMADAGAGTSASVPEITPSGSASDIGEEAASASVNDGDTHARAESRKEEFAELAASVAALDTDSVQLALGLTAMRVDADGNPTQDGGLAHADVDVTVVPDEKGSF